MTRPMPRLSFEEIDPELQNLLKPTVERLGYFGEMFQVMAHLPKGLDCFMKYTAAVRDPLSFNLNEVCALTVCSRMGADYERIQHERLSLRTGLDREWIGELTGVIHPKPGRLSAEEAKVRDLALAMVNRGGKDCEAEVGAVVDALGPTRAMAVMLQITRFMNISILVNALQVALPVPSIFDEEPPLAG